MTNSGNRHRDDFRIRSSSANEASKPIFVQSKSQFIKSFNFSSSSGKFFHSYNIYFVIIYFVFILCFCCFTYCNIKKFV